MKNTNFGWLFDVLHHIIKPYKKKTCLAFFLFEKKGKESAKHVLCLCGLIGTALFESIESLCRDYK